MINRDKENLFKFDTSEWQSGALIIPKEITDKLKSEKVENISITINKSNTELLRKLNIDQIVFDKIKKIQQLPDDVVINFLLAESSLSETDFADRISNARE